MRNAPKRISILPSTLLIALVATSLTGAGCSKKSKPAATVPVESTSQAPIDRDGTPGDGRRDDQPLADPSASLTGVMFFEFDSSTLTQAGRDALEGNAEWLRQEPSRTLTIEGHTDEAGTSEYNLALGDRRARAAQEYLVRLGIAADRIRVVTFGEEKPASSEDSENRRAVFVSAKP